MLTAVEALDRADRALLDARRHGAHLPRLNRELRQRFVLVGPVPAVAGPVRMGARGCRRVAVAIAAAAARTPQAPQQRPSSLAAEAARRALERDALSHPALVHRPCAAQLAHL